MPIKASIRHAEYSSVYLNGREVGSLCICSCTIKDELKEITILEVDPKRDESYAIKYCFDYVECQIESKTYFGPIRAAYKVSYIKNLTLIADLIVAKLQAENAV